MRNVDFGDAGYSCFNLWNSWRGGWLFLSLPVAAETTRNGSDGNGNFCSLRDYVRNIVQQVYPPRKLCGAAGSPAAIHFPLFAAHFFRIVFRRATISNLVVIGPAPKGADVDLAGIDLTCLIKPFYLNASLFT